MSRTLRADIRRHRTVNGFTLIELLTVIVIIGILSIALVAFSANSLRKTQLRDGAVQLLTDLRQARSQAQRSSQSSSVTLASTSVGAPATTYTTVWGSNTPQATTVRTLTLPIRVAPYISSTPANRTEKINYSAPYGEVTGTGIVWEVSSAAISDKLYVKAVGVTGKVVLSASPN